MILLGNWWEPASDGLDVGDVAAIVGLILSLIGLVSAIAFGVRRLDAWRDKRHRVDVEDVMAPHLAKLHEEMDEQTANLVALLTELTLPIQKTTNGGKSLPDLHEKVDRVIAEQHSGALAASRLEGRMAHLEEQQVYTATAQLQMAAERTRIVEAADANAAAVKRALRELGAELDLKPLRPIDDGR